MVILTLCVSLSTQMTARFIRAVVVSRVFLLPCHGRNRVFHTHSSAVLGSSLHTLTLPAAWRQVSSISIHLLTREFTLLEICMIYHQAEKVSQCDWTTVVKGAQHPFIGRLCTLSHCLRHGGRFRLMRIIRRLHGSRSRLVMSEMFVFCSGLLVSLTFEL